MRESPAEVRLTSLRLLFQTLWKLKQTSIPRLHLVHVFKTALQPQQLLTKVDVLGKVLLLSPCVQSFPGKGLRQKEKPK